MELRRVRGTDTQTDPGGRSGLRAGEAEAVRANRSSAGERSMRQPKSRVMNRDEYDAVLFDLDGVITNTAKLHATCWKQMLDEYLQKRAVERGESFRPFDLATDYRLYLDGSRVLTAFGIFSLHAGSDCLRETQTIPHKLKRCARSAIARTSWSV